MKRDLVLPEGTTIADLECVRAHREARSKFQPERVDRLIGLIRAGNYVTTACGSVGLDPVTFSHWLAKGREGKEPYATFRRDVEKAVADAEARDVAYIARAAETDWKAAAWRLEKRLPHKWGGSPKQAVQEMVNEELQRAVDRLREVLPQRYFEAAARALMEPAGEE